MEKPMFDLTKIAETGSPQLVVDESANGARRYFLDGYELKTVLAGSVNIRPVGNYVEFTVTIHAKSPFAPELKESQE